jgi:hypothetical protein
VSAFERQILVNLGNRWVLYGPSATLPVAPRLTPADGKELPRVADESEHAEQRILQTMRVSNAEVQTEPEGSDADFRITDDAGHITLVEIKVRETDPKKRDFDAITQWLKRDESDDGYTREVWFFNIERLRLTVFSENDRHGFDYIELVPLNVWEYVKDGVFERSRVVAQVDDWAERLDRLYKEIERWAAKQGFRTAFALRFIETTRSRFSRKSQ